MIYIQLGIIAVNLYLLYNAISQHKRLDKIEKRLKENKIENITFRVDTKRENLPFIETPKNQKD